MQRVKFTCLLTPAACVGSFRQTPGWGAHIRQLSPPWPQCHPLLVQQQYCWFHPHRAAPSAYQLYDNKYINSLILHSQVDIQFPSTHTKPKTFFVQSPKIYAKLIWSDQEGKFHVIKATFVMSNNQRMNQILLLKSINAWYPDHEIVLQHQTTTFKCQSS